VDGLAASARSQIAARLATARTDVEALSRRLNRQSPVLRLGRDRQRIDDLTRRAALAMAGRLRTARERLNGLRLHLSALDPTAVLARGYAIVNTPGGNVISSVAQVHPGDALHVRVADGAFSAIAQP
jgi:exodeoxyribonuclease VII large subunit